MQGLQKTNFTHVDHLCPIIMITALKTSVWLGGCIHALESCTSWEIGTDKSPCPVFHYH